MPSPTIMALGIGGGFCSQYWLEYDMNQSIQQKRFTDKPPYFVPPMADIAAITGTNGLTSISTFSGAGGSCLGFRMAGFRVAWASEFVGYAAAAYRANHNCHLDTRDIRVVSAKDIMHTTGLAVGELDVFEGSPPCDSFSTAGKREKGWGKVKAYRGGEKIQRTDDLFFVWIKLLQELKPKAFVAENVSGLVKGTAKGQFKRILMAMKESGYATRAMLLDAQWLGVPQRRQRVIFIGIRNDLGKRPIFPAPIPWQYTVREACPWIGNDAKQTFGDHFKERYGTINQPSQTVTASPDDRHGKIEERVLYTNGGFDVDRDVTDEVVPAITATQCRMDVVHDTGKFQRNKPIADEPCPAITVGVESVNSTHFLVRGKSDNDETKTGRRVAMDNVHRRKFTISEVKRLCAFPDDFDLSPAGSYANQWSCLGMSVPPVMMAHVAASISHALGSEPSDVYWSLPGASHAAKTWKT